jgi:hypothetical protein
MWLHVGVGFGCTLACMPHGVVCGMGALGWGALEGLRALEYRVWVQDVPRGVGWLWHQLAGSRSVPASARCLDCGRT